MEDVLESFKQEMEKMYGKVIRGLDGVRILEKNNFKSIVLDIRTCFDTKKFAIVEYRGYPVYVQIVGECADTKQ